MKRRLLESSSQPSEPGVTARSVDDPLGYDVSDLAAATRQMADDVRSGKTAAAVEAELAAVRRLLNRRPSL